MATRATIYDRDGITSDDGVPGASTTRADARAFPEIAWYITADDQTDSATVTPWYLLGDDWHKGTSQSITGNTVVLGYSLQGQVALQLTSVTVAGTGLRVRAQLIEKTA